MFTWNTYRKYLTLEIKKNTRDLLGSGCFLLNCLFPSRDIGPSASPFLGTFLEFFLVLRKAVFEVAPSNYFC